MSKNKIHFTTVLWPNILSFDELPNSRTVLHSEKSLIFCDRVRLAKFHMILSHHVLDHAKSLYKMRWLLFASTMCWGTPAIFRMENASISWFLSASPLTCFCDHSMFLVLTAYVQLKEFLYKIEICYEQTKIRSNSLNRPLPRSLAYAVLFQNLTYAPFFRHRSLRGLDASGDQCVLPSRLY